MQIAETLALLRNEIPHEVKIIAVSKTRTVRDIQDAYNAGQRVFGENRVQELILKQPVLPHDIEWHLIGHLQTNKVKFIAPFIQLIHSVDSLKLLAEINKEAAKANRTINCLLEMRIATEETKYGLSVRDAAQILKSDEYHRLGHVNVIGVMGMATFTEDTGLVKQEFIKLQNIYNNLKTQFFSNNNDFKELSMGMSGDYKLAIEAGSTMVRIGTLIFGERSYTL
jgi:PLP dependent protein